ncbi:hypothetical protein IAR55_002972 [Kwoniella newhampshirensis]|uniref:Ubiquitin-like domain-containing protein n=1 Tax=Kwoniella newhampshirensis TaxID=1651941 RepID=A0AAW0Z055_9TREE
MSPPNPASSSNENEPLLPTSTSSTPSGPASRRLQARRYIHPQTSPLSKHKLSLGTQIKGKGKAKARSSGSSSSEESSNEDDQGDPERAATAIAAAGGERVTKVAGRLRGKGKGKETERGRHVTIIFGNESQVTGGNLEIWVEDGENVGGVKEQIRHLRPALSPLNLRLIHSGRLLTDGILLLPWLRTLEERVRRQAAGVGGEVESVLKDVGLGEDDDDDDGGDDDEGQRDGAKGGGRGRKREGSSGDERVWLHCIVGGREERKAVDEEEATPAAPRRRGFDVLLDAGLSAAEVAQMRRQFYESRGEEVPEGMDLGDVNDEHARALEEQWIEGDMTAETATTSTEGLYTSILHGLLTGFLFAIIPWFFFRELPLPNFFDADAEALTLFQARTQAHSETQSGPQGDSTTTTRRDSSNDSHPGQGGGPSTTAAAAAVAGAAGAETQSGDMGRRVAARVAGNLGVGGETLTGQVFGKRMQMGILLGTILNFAFGVLRMIN